MKHTSSSGRNFPPEKTGGIIHTYQGYDPIQFPSPRVPPPEVASAAMEHLLFYGNTRELTEEELANAVQIDPSQIRGLGPSLEALIQMLEERKRKILQTYRTEEAQKEAHENFHQSAAQYKPPKNLAAAFEKAVRSEQLYELESLYYLSGRNAFGKAILALTQKLAEKYQVDELASKYSFTGKTPMNVPKALEIKEELEQIDKLLEQLREAKKNAKIGIIDAVILGMGRAIGETMAVLMVVGNAPVFFRGLGKPISTLTSQIVMDMPYASGTHRTALFGLAIILFLISMGLVALVRGLSRLREESR